MKRILFAVCMATALTSVAQAQRPQDGNYIVTFRDGISRNDKAATVQRAGGRVKFNYSIINAAAISVPNENALNGLARNPWVESITEDLTVQAIPASRDPQANAKPGPPT